MRLPALGTFRGLVSHPNRWVRWAGRLTFVALGIVLLVGIFSGAKAALWTITGFWIAANALFAGGIFIWGLFHPRATLQAGSVLSTWALWIALLAALSLPGSIETSLTETRGFVFSTSFLALSAFTTFFLVLLFALAAGWLGASMGAFIHSPDDDGASGSRSGVAALWIAVLLSIGLSLLIHQLSGVQVYTFLISGVPLAAVTILLLLKRYQTTPSHLLLQVVRRLNHRLLLRWQIKNREVRTDFRGAFLGLMAGGLALVIVATNLFVPLQTWWMLWFIQFRNAPMVSNQQEMSLKQFAGMKTTAREQIVLLRIDPSTRREMLMTGSETAIQAEVIRHLKSWDVKWIVLPLPTVTESEASPMNNRFDPAVDRQDILRSQRDMPLLEKAIKEAGNVILSVDSDLFVEGVDEEQPKEAGDRRTKTIETLSKVAYATGSATFSAYLSPRLPCIRLPEPDRQTQLPIPLLLTMNQGNEQIPAPESVLRQDWNRLPQIRRGLVLIDFYGTRAGQAFAEVPYTAVRNQEPLYAGKQDEAPKGVETGFKLQFGNIPGMMEVQVPPSAITGDSGWVPPSEFFKDKLVFLDSPGMLTQETPIGSMSESELLAQATATLMDRSAVSQPAWWTTAPVLLALTMLTGAVCQRKTPVAALWRALLLIFVILIGTVASFVMLRLWVDPTLSLLGIAGTTILVTQLTFSLEQSERARNRALLQRFVAPEIVEELLDEPPEKLGLGGRRQPVCVMFADIRNFTHFAEQSTSEQVIETVNLYLSAMTDALNKHGGLLDKYLGDGLMALFRLETEQEEALKRAVQAAIAMQDAAEQVSMRLQQQSKPTLQIGIALHAGEAVVGLVGNPNQFNYTALGETVILCQRLQSLAGGGEIILSETVYRAVSGGVQAEACEPVQLKGLSAPVSYYRIKSRALERLS